MKIMSSAVLCFQHCEKKRNILCFHVPVICPLCGKDTEKTESRIPPFVLDSPFSTCADNPFSIVIRPTNGHFLVDYAEGCDLHIGVTSSQGLVYEFDEDGINIGSCKWDSCVCVQIIDQQSYGSWCQLWDDQLVMFSSQSDWTKERYNERYHNCFDFVLEYLRSLPPHQKSAFLRSKRQFCEDVVIPHTTKINQYISAYNQIRESGFAVVPVDR